MAVDDEDKDKDLSLSQEDADLWKIVADDVTAFKGKKLVKPSREKEDLKQSAGEMQMRQEEVGKKPKADKENGFSYLHHGEVVGVDYQTAKRLKSGKLKIEAFLDLHGLNQEEAFSQLDYFINTAYELGKRVLCVVTGKGHRSKGEGVLLGMVPKWLNATGVRDKILMYCYAHQKDGGKGALYVLVRRKNKNG